MSQPLQNRLLIATSSDGLNFKKLGTVLYNFADVPDAVVSSSNRGFVYFQGILEPYHDVITVGTSPNGVSNWSFQLITIAGTETWPVRPCDPDVVFKGGVFRLYFTGDPLNDRIPETYSAISTDGIHFTLENGVRFSGVDRPVLDPSLLWIGDTLHYFAGGGSPTLNWHAISLDGLQFKKVDDFSANGLMMSNGIKVSGGYRFYGFPNKPPPEMNIQSISSSDGITWSLDPGVRLQRDASNSLEGMYVKDPAVVFKDSVYIMYYVTRKPEYSSVYPSGIDSPPQFGLFQNYPNPFSAGGRSAYGGNPETAISYQLVANSFVNLRVFDVLGRKVATLVDAERPAGKHSVTWDASKMAGGIYFYILEAGEFREAKRMVLLR